MRIRNIATSLAIAGTTLLNTGCKNNTNKIVQPIEKQAKVIVKDSIPQKYADLKIYCGFEPKQDIKIENGVSFTTENIKYSASDGEVSGEFLNIKDDIKNESSKFKVKVRDYSLNTIETIKMLAGFTKESGIKDTLTLSKADIIDAQSRLKKGSIWTDAKNYFDKTGESYLRFGKVKHIKNPEGIKIDIYDRSDKLSDIQFNIEQ